MHAAAPAPGRRRLAISIVSSMALGMLAGAAHGQESSGSSATSNSSEAKASAELAERALDRLLVTTGVVLLPKGFLEVEPSFLYVRNEESSPAVFTDSSGAVYVAEQRLNQDSIDVSAQLRLGLPGDMQLELGIPYEYVRTQRVTEVSLAPQESGTASLSGLGDVVPGIAKTLLTEAPGRPNLVARLSWYTDTGRANAAKGLYTGSGYNAARLSFLATKRQDPLVFIGGPFYERSFEEHGLRQGDQIGGSFGVALAASPETSLRVVLDETFVRDTERERTVLGGTEQNIGVLTLGASSTVYAGMFLDFVVQAGLTRDAPALGAGVSFSMRFHL
jgi:hypothetical protein